MPSAASPMACMLFFTKSLGVFHVPEPLLVCRFPSLLLISLGHSWSPVFVFGAALALLQGRAALLRGRGALGGGRQPYEGVLRVLHAGGLSYKTIPHQRPKLCGIGAIGVYWQSQWSCPMQEIGDFKSQPF